MTMFLPAGQKITQPFLKGTTFLLSSSTIQITSGRLDRSKAHRFQRSSSTGERAWH